MDEGQCLIMEDEKKLHVFSEEDFECTVEITKDESNDERELTSLKSAAAHVAKTTSFSATEAGDALVECQASNLDFQGCYFLTAKSQASRDCMGSYQIDTERFRLLPASIDGSASRRW